MENIDKHEKKFEENPEEDRKEKFDEDDYKARRAMMDYSSPPDACLIRLNGADEETLVKNLKQTIGFISYTTMSTVVV